MPNYDFSAIEAKWHKYWEENDTFHTDVWDFSKPKYYVLICSLIPPVWVCTQAIPRAIPLRILCPA